MPQVSQLLLSGDFVQGVTSYRDHYPGEEQAVRVVENTFYFGTVD
jgi:hypothetical protein